METFITGDKFIGEGESGHETTLLQPEDRGEGATEENTLDGSKCNKALCEGGILILDPSDGPIGLLADTWNYGLLALASKVRGRWTE